MEKNDYCRDVGSFVPQRTRCKIAKVIACHNIFVSSVGEQEKYRVYKLHRLIPGNAKFYKMPHAQNYLRNDYEKLYYMLCLTDVLEPSKRGLSLHNIDFDICFSGDKYIIDILGANDGYLEIVRGAADWLTGINIFQDGQ